MVRWWVYDSSKERDKIERLVNRMILCCFLPESTLTTAQLAEAADDRLSKPVVKTIAMYSEVCPSPP